MGFFEVVGAVLLALILFYAVLVYVGYTVLKKHFSRQIEEIMHPPFIILPENPQPTGNIYDSQGVLFEATTPPDPVEPEIMPDPDDIPEDEEAEVRELASQTTDEDMLTWPKVSEEWVNSRLTDKQFELLTRIGTLVELPGPNDGFFPTTYRVHPQVMEKYDGIYRSMVGNYG